jgi:hypothetical protein
MTRIANEFYGNDRDVSFAGDLRVDIGQQRVTRAGIDVNLPNLSCQRLLALKRRGAPLFVGEIGHGNLGTSLI